MNTDVVQNARAAYEAYAKAMGITRLWDELTVKEAMAWMKAANAGQGYQGPG